MENLNLSQLEDVNGGGNINDCIGAIGGMGGGAAAVAGALTMTGPLGWVALGGSAVGLYAASFLTGFNCTRLSIQGD